MQKHGGVAACALFMELQEASRTAAQWEEAVRDKGLACQELLTFWRQGPAYLPGLD